MLLEGCLASRETHVQRGTHELAVGCKRQSYNHALRPCVRESRTQHVHLSSPCGVFEPQHAKYQMMHMKSAQGCQMITEILISHEIAGGDWSAAGMGTAKAPESAWLETSCLTL